MPSSARGSEKGGTSEGDWHGAMNFAGIHDLPLVFVCENNQYAISVHESKQVAGRVFERAKAYGFPGKEGDGNDILLSVQAHEGSGRSRPGRRRAVVDRIAHLSLLLAHLRRRRSHLRSREEVHEWRNKDPVPRSRNTSRAEVLVDAEVDEAQGTHEGGGAGGRQGGRGGRLPGSRYCRRYVYVDAGVNRVADKTLIQAVHDTLVDAMQRDDSVVVFGEDVGAQGRCVPGHHGLHRGVRRPESDRYAARRVSDRGSRHRHGVRRHASGRRDAVCRLHLSGVQPDRFGGGHAFAIARTATSTCRW